MFKAWLLWMYRLLEWLLCRLFEKISFELWGRLHLFLNLVSWIERQVAINPDHVQLFFDYVRHENWRFFASVDAVLRWHFIFWAIIWLSCLTWLHFKLDLRLVRWTIQWRYLSPKHVKLRFKFLHSFLKIMDLACVSGFGFWKCLHKNFWSLALAVDVRGRLRIFGSCWRWLLLCSWSWSVNAGVLS